jgi:hypothetical protein
MYQANGTAEGREAGHEDGHSLLADVVSSAMRGSKAARFAAYRPGRQSNDPDH